VGRRIVILSGAGLSAESGLGTFRDAGGVWTRFDWRRLATPEAFAEDPASVHAFYNARRANLLEAAPNPAHAALARLQAARPGVTLVTQNVDDLLERAGASGVLHMHGELRRAWCLSCGWKGVWDSDLSHADDCPACGPQGRLRPDIVWFGEMPYHMDAIEAALEAADVFVSIGTSGSVYPAAGFVAQARALGLATLELNLEPSDNAFHFDEGRYGPASAIVPAWVDKMLAA
jgi:NAD-dependent deacetylase